MNLPRCAGESALITGDGRGIAYCLKSQIAQAAARS
jgi:hypothetical protein